MKLPASTRLRAAAAVCLLLAGCALPKPHPLPAQTSYRLQSAALRVQATLQAPLSIHVLAVDAAAGLERGDLLYSAQPQQLLAYRDSRWLSPPALMIRDALAQTLAAQSWVASVSEDTLLAPADLTLHCDLDQLEHDVSSSQMRLQLRCQLLGAAGPGRVGSWTLRQLVTMPVNDAPHAAAAAQQALDAATGELLRDIAASLAG